jgi:transposase
MDEREQRFVIKLLWLQGLGKKAIHAQLSSRLAGTDLSLSIVQRWLRHFKEGNTSYENAARPRRPTVIIGDILSKFLARYPFASAKVMSRHFGVSSSTVKEVLICELGLRKYAGRWVPHLLDDTQKNHRPAPEIELFELLRGRKAYYFNGIATGDEL